MLHLRKINKIRRIVKALPGAVLLPLSVDLSSMVNNPYLATDGKPLTVNTSNLDVDKPSFWDMTLYKGKLWLKDNPDAILKGMNFIDNAFLLPNYQGKYGSTSQALRGLGDMALGSNPLYQTLSFGSNLITKIGGKSFTTNITNKYDAVAHAIPGVDPINGMWGKKTREFSMNRDLISKMGGAYTGLINKGFDAEERADKKIGLAGLAAGELGKDNEFIADIAAKIRGAENVAKEAGDRASIATNMSDINHINYGNKINNALNILYSANAKLGGTLKRVKKINFHKIGGEIKESLTIIEEKWEPIIVLEEGGNIEWKPELNIFLEDELNLYKQGGKSEEVKESSKVDETSLKNVIPEGALHAYKHNMENADNLTKKGIPVVDNDGIQQAEIERDEIILSLELTKTLENLYSQYNEDISLAKKDEIAIEAGKLLVHEILENTDDRTGLISKCENGGVIDGTK